MAGTLRRVLDSVGWWGALARRGPTRLLAVNALVDAAGTGLAAVCLPFLAVTVIGLSAAELGLMLTVLGGCELLAAVPNGVLAARVGVWRFSLAAKLVQAAAAALLALAGHLAVALVAAAVVGVARAGASGLNQSLTVSVLGEDHRSGALGAVRALRNIGYLVSGGAGALLLATGQPALLRVALLADAASFVVGAWCVWRLRPRTPPVLPDRNDWSVLRDVRYGALVLCAAVFGSSLVVLDVGLPLWALAHPQSVPAWTIPLVVVVNTALVVLLQYRFSKRAATVRAALRGLRLSALAFAAMAVLVALTARAPTGVAVLLLAAGAVALTVGELTESPSWWTLSYELAPAERKNEYLAAFDLSWAVVGIAGPVAMVLVVSAGAAGWLVYAAVLAAAATAAGLLVGQRAREPSGRAG